MFKNSQERNRVLLYCKRTAHQAIVQLFGPDSGNSTQEHISETIARVAEVFVPAFNTPKRNRKLWVPNPKGGYDGWIEYTSAELFEHFAGIAIHKGTYSNAVDCAHQLWPGDKRESAFESLRELRNNPKEEYEPLQQLALDDSEIDTVIRAARVVTTTGIGNGEMYEQTLRDQVRESLAPYIVSRGTVGNWFRDLTLDEVLNAEAILNQTLPPSVRIIELNRYLRKIYVGGAES